MSGCSGILRFRHQRHFSYLFKLFLIPAQTAKPSTRSRPGVVIQYTVCVYCITIDVSYCQPVTKPAACTLRGYSRPFHPDIVRVLLCSFVTQLY